MTWFGQPPKTVKNAQKHINIIINIRWLQSVVARNDRRARRARRAWAQKNQKDFIQIAFKHFSRYLYNVKLYNIS